MIFFHLDQPACVGDGLAKLKIRKSKVGDKSSNMLVEFETTWNLGGLEHDFGTALEKYFQIIFD